MNSMDSGINSNVAGGAAGQGFELGDILRILAERRKIILGVGVLGLVLGIIATLLMTPQYRGTALLELNTPTVDVANAGSKQAAAASRASNQEMVATAMGLLQSETLAQRVVEDLNLASSPEFGGEEGARDQRTKRAVGLLRARTEIEGGKGSLLVRVSYTSTDPVQAANVANALAQGFVASSLERRYDSSSFARKFLSDQLEKTKLALEESERNLNAYSNNSQIFSLSSEDSEGNAKEGMTLAVADLRAVNQALKQAQVARIVAEQNYRNTGTDFDAEQAALNNVGSTRIQRAELKGLYEEKAKLFKPEYPQMRELAARIAELDKIISGERLRTISNKRAHLRALYETAQRTEAQLAATVAGAKGDVQSERTRMIQYKILQREASTNSALYDALLQRYKEIGVGGGVGQSNVSVVDQAKPPQGPYSPRLPVNAGLGLVLGLALGVGLAFAVHLLFDAIIDPADVRSKLHLPVLGVIPFEDEDRTLMESLADRKSDISEAYYSVRTALKFARPEGAPRTLLVTSTRPGEGKSTSAYAIASSMARLGSKVLLIDADLRKPTFVSSREDGYGLAHLLGTEEPLAAYSEKTQVENLSLLPVGRFVGSAAELLSSNRLPAIIAEARDNFEMVVIDGPPVLGLTDAPLLGSVTEATALVIESRSSRTGNVSEMVRRLIESGAKIVGVVLTKVTTNGGRYGYGYSYGYGGDQVGGRVGNDPERALDLTTVKG